MLESDVCLYCTAPSDEKLRAEKLLLKAVVYLGCAHLETETSSTMPSPLPPTSTIAAKFPSPGNFLEELGGRLGELSGGTVFRRVRSSHLSEIAFYPDTNVLDIKFANGAVYRYYDIERPVIEGLLRSSSKGRYFWQLIRGWYDYDRIEGPTKR